MLNEKDVDKLVATAGIQQRAFDGEVRAGHQMTWDDGQRDNLIDGLMGEIPGFRDRLHEALNAHDMSGLMATVRYFREVLAVLQVDTLFRLARELENSVKAADTETIGGAVRNLERELSHLLQISEDTA